ncbi:glycosyltransferase family 4 protein [Thiorhodovibrio frisius]|uniref:Glycosyltransferase n=1 Tax=Thiorhodovibrio frisius TaxID=631362 RepID=H8Z1S8_9GAMM|nr:glycosyltransferase family 4 protein [Thiorhodovibrio frisius]EIC22556.1 glycosyltransferase [Thiorhodovibrio frisius]WPL19997.1 N,N'-diacetylbacillosaminyl-diphospho-undecaprenol alpha-1,3-N-acetylgalactosaminyltransferase [Thiorhodovibrio frisius]
MTRLLFVVSEDWFFVSHRLHLAQTAIQEGFQVALLTRIADQRAKIEQAGVTVFDWQLERGSRNPLLEFKALIGLVRAMRAFRPDLIHAVAMQPVLHATAGAWLTGVRRRVLALSGLGFVFSSAKLRARLLRPPLSAALRLALNGEHTRLILQNPDDCRVLVDAKVARPGCIRMIRSSGVDTSVFLPGTGQPSTPLVILPGRMLWDKGVGEFVSCARALKAAKVPARFALVGDPDLRNPESVPLARLHQWVDEGVVEWWGRRADMPAVLAQADIVCLPSYREGLPLALLEAASCGLPIVTFDVPGCREAVEHGRTGFLVPFGDQGMLNEAIASLLADESMRRGFGDAGRDKVLREFTRERVARETLAVWKEVLGLP